LLLVHVNNNNNHIEEYRTKFILTEHFMWQIEAIVEL
jgi:hypothetical protein